MYKNLNCDLLDISGRQSELIELALTYGFKGIDIDISDLVKRCQRSSFESASKFLTSAKLFIGGFETPVDLDSDDETFTSQAALLNGVAEIAGRAQAKIAIVSIPTGTDRLPYPEYFEVIRKRIDEVAATFAKEGIRVALAFSADGESTQAKQFKFIQDAKGFAALAKSCKAAGIVFDSWNWFCGGGTETLLDEIGIGRVFAVRIGDCVEGVSPDAATRQDCLLPGSTGVIDNLAYLRKFVEAGLNLPVSPMGRLAEPGGTRDAFVGKTQDALNKTLQEAGIAIQARKPESYEASYASH